MIMIAIRGNTTRLYNIQNNSLVGTVNINHDDVDDYITSAILLD